MKRTGANANPPATATPIIVPIIQLACDLTPSLANREDRRSHRNQGPRRKAVDPAERSFVEFAYPERRNRDAQHCAYPCPSENSVSEVPFGKRQICAPQSRREYGDCQIQPDDHCRNPQQHVTNKVPRRQSEARGTSGRCRTGWPTRQLPLKPRVLSLQALQHAGVRHSQAAPNLAFHLKNEFWLIPCFRHTLAVFMPRSCSARIAMICSSLSLDCLMSASSVTDSPIRRGKLRGAGHLGYWLAAPETIVIPSWPPGSVPSVIHVGWQTLYALIFEPDQSPGAGLPRMLPVQPRESGQ